MKFNKSKIIDFSHTKLNESHNERCDFSNLNEKSLNDDIKMINEFIEFKLFKKIMNQKGNNNIH